MPRKPRPKIGAIEPLEIPAANPIRRFSQNPANTYETWLAKAERAKTTVEKQQMMATAYVCDDGFSHFVQKFVLDRAMHAPFHGRMAKFIVGIGVDYYPVKRKRLLLAFRGSWKSHFLFAYGAWLIAREFVLSQPSRDRQGEIDRMLKEGRAHDDPEIKVLEDDMAKRIERGEWLAGVNIRIGCQSEAMELAEGTVETILGILDRPDYQRYFGSHAPKDRTKGGKWGKTGAVSAFRTRPLRDATLFTISLKQPRIGSHPDVILSDDFQAENTADSAGQRAKSWKMWKANDELLPPPSQSFYSEAVAAATRWHSADNYGRQMRENENLAKMDRVSIIEMPVCDAAGNPNCPTIYDREGLQSWKSQGIDKFNTQGLLKPVGGKTQPFQPEDVKTYHSFGWSQYERDRMYAVTGCDCCWLDAARKGDSASDHAVVFTLLVSPAWHFFLVDWWHEQADRKKTIYEVYRQSIAHGVKAHGFSMADRVSIEPIMDEISFARKYTWNPEWVSDLKGGEGVDVATTKNRKIIGRLQPLVQARRLHILPGLSWLEEEMIDCPRGATDNGLDALVCAVVAAGQPTELRPEPPQPEEGPLTMGKFYEGLKNGRPVDLVTGKRVRRSRASLNSRRPRSKIPLP